MCGGTEPGSLYNPKDLQQMLLGPKSSGEIFTNMCALRNNYETPQQHPLPSSQKSSGYGTIKLYIYMNTYGFGGGRSKTQLH